MRRVLLTALMACMAFAVLPGALRAGLVTYSYSATGPSGASFVGSFQVDEANLVDLQISVGEIINESFTGTLPGHPGVVFNDLTSITNISNGSTVINLNASLAPTSLNQLGFRSVTNPFGAGAQSFITSYVEFNYLSLYPVDRSYIGYSFDNTPPPDEEVLLTGTWTFSGPQAVPEPGSLVLVASAVGSGLVIRCADGNGPRFALKVDSRLLQ